MVLIFIYIYKYIGSRDQLIVQNVLLSKCAELLAKSGLLTLVTAKLTLKGALFTIVSAPLLFPERWNGEQTCVILRSQA